MPERPVSKDQNEIDKFIKTGEGISVRSYENGIASYKVNDIETVGSVTYIGRESPNGEWCILKIDETSGTSMSYATILNNTSTADYSTGWTNRASLTYNDYSVVF